MYNCIIVDDSLIERDLVAFHLSKIKNLNIVAECEDGLSALEIIQNNEIDIVFSDIDMPDFSGISLVKSLKNAPVFVFISSYANYAAESFDLDVIDFIVKPASLERVIKAANKATEYLDLKRNLLQQSQHAEIANLSQESHGFIFVKENNSHLKLSFANICYIESLGDFSKIFTVNDTMHVILVSLKKIAEQLPSAIFKRVHKQYIVNINHIVSVEPTEISLAKNKTVPLSNSYKTDFMEKVVELNSLKRFN